MNLVVAVVGDSSLHKKWLEAKDFKNFDLFLIYYGKHPDKYYADCDFYKQQKGYKFPLTYEYLYNQIALDQYDYFWLPDEDILAATADVNLLFHMMEKSEFFIAQPSLKKDCPHTWPHTTTRPSNVSRSTNFVEIMCPIFSLPALKTFLPTFVESKTGWGLDRYWSAKTLEMKKKLGIFDIVTVEHKRKMGEGKLYKQLEKEGVNYKKEYQDFLKKYNLTHIRQSEKSEWE